MIATWDILVEGIVQGVGFRPFIFNLAVERGLKGRVQNSSRGVEITVTGNDADIATFIDAVRRFAPPLAHIVNITARRVEKIDFADFTIDTSGATGGVTLVSPDVAVCPDCERELFDPDDRRHNYAFINCTNCGPRYSIIEHMPYDRPATTMKDFPMCEDCAAEYHDPKNRRFHAQPNCCPVCGPEVFLGEHTGIDAVTEAARLIDAGQTVAVKGLGGYHLVCDAANDDAIRALREKKHRPTKPFAIMCRDIETLEKHVDLDPAARRVLMSPQAPIVIIPWESDTVSHLVNPLGVEHNRIGVMIATTPLHKLLCDAVSSDFIVATSGNVTDEPICKDIDEAEEKLSRFTKHFLHHNRPIHTRIDDSVAAIHRGRIYIIRRARGFAPYPVMLPMAVESCVLGVGGHYKNTIALTTGSYAFVSQYLGDLDTVETETFFEEVYHNMRAMFGLSPDIVVRDLHPEFTSTAFAEKLGVAVQSMQHHEAHLFSCMAENGLVGNVIGVVFDGVGLGRDGTAWGGEFFMRREGSVIRRFHLACHKQPGMDAAAKHPARMLLSYLWRGGLFAPYEDLISERLGISGTDVALVLNMVRNDINCIDTSSMGRLFEALGALVAGVPVNDFEGHAAIRLEHMADRQEEGAYEVHLTENTVSVMPLVSGVLGDLAAGESDAVVAARIHNTVARMVMMTCHVMRDESGINEVVLSGGVFQNMLLLDLATRRLESDGFKVYTHSKVPANDGAVALGQAYGACLNLSNN